MFIGYIQNNEDKAEKARQYQAVQSFAKAQGLKLDCICADYTFADIKGILLSETDGIVIFNISALGDGLAQIKENLLFCREHKLQIYSIEDGYHFNETNLTDDFFKLLARHYRTEHNVGFYAERLNRTPKYLSGAIRRLSGRSVPDWIDSMLLREIKFLLKTTDKTILEISEELNFSSPSVFIQFFRRHAGVTPLQYRRQG